MCALTRMNELGGMGAAEWIHWKKKNEQTKLRPPQISFLVEIKVFHFLESYILTAAASYILRKGPFSLVSIVKSK